MNSQLVAHVLGQRTFSKIFILCQLLHVTDKIRLHWCTVKLWVEQFYWSSVRALRNLNCTYFRLTLEVLYVELALSHSTSYCFLWPQNTIDWMQERLLTIYQPWATSCCINFSFRVRKQPIEFNSIQWNAECTQIYCNEANMCSQCTSHAHITIHVYS